MNRFLTEVCTMEWHMAHDLGTPFEVSCARLAAEHPEYAEMIWAWGRRSEEMIAGPIDGTVDILRALRRRGIRCYALTNMEAETYPQRLERYEFLRWFDGTVVSAAEGVAKPDAEIFTRLLRRFGLTTRPTSRRRRLWGCRRSASSHRRSCGAGWSKRTSCRPIGEPRTTRPG